MQGIRHDPVDQQRAGRKESRAEKEAVFHRSFRVHFFPDVEKGQTLVAPRHRVMGCES